jgi:hypothetical protein
MGDQNTALQLRVVEEPVFQLEQPGKLREIVWVLQGLFGKEVEQSREEYLVGQFSFGVEAYAASVDRMRVYVDGLREAYEKLTKSLHQDERKLRAAKVAIDQPYSLDMRLLGHGTEDGVTDEPVYRVFSTGEDIEGIVAELHEGIAQLERESPEAFAAKYHTTIDAYRTAAMYVLNELEKEKLRRSDARIDYEELGRKVNRKKKRLGQDLETYCDARRRYIGYSHLRDDLESEGQARAMIIQAATEAERLELGGAMLLELYERLAPAEALARVELSKGSRLEGISEKQGRALTLTVKELGVEE